MRVRHLLVAGGVVASTLSVAAPPALADHNTCGSGHGFQYNAPLQEASTGTVDGFDTTDFWRDTSGVVGSETLRLVVLTPVTGDSDLYVWSGDCSQIICVSLAGAGSADTCLVDYGGDTYVEARNYGGTSSQYTLTVTYSPFFIH